MSYSISAPYFPGFKLRMNISSAMLSTSESTSEELLTKSKANVSMNRLKTWQKLAEPHFQAVSWMVQGKFRGHKLTKPPLKIQDSLKLYIDCTVFPEVFWCIESSPTKEMLFSTHFCRWQTEVQPHLVKTALSNLCTCLAPGWPLRQILFLLQQDQQKRLHAYSLALQYKPPSWRWDAVMRAGEAEARVHVPSWLWAAWRGNL